MIELKLVRSRKDKKDFLAFASRSEIPSQTVAELDVVANPFFKHALMRPLLALREGRIVGTVMGWIDFERNQTLGEATGFFGYLAYAGDTAVGQQLMEAITHWAHQERMTHLRGPVLPNSDLNPGVLVGKSSIFEQWGFAPHNDLRVYEIDREARFSEQILAQAELLKQDSQLKLRPLDMRDFDADVARLWQVYMQSPIGAERPLQAEDFRYLARRWKRRLNPELVLIAEKSGDCVGFTLAFPTEVSRRFRVALMVQTGGESLAPLFCTEYLARATRLGFDQAEIGLISAGSQELTRTVELLGAKKNQVYRIYERVLGS